METTMETPSQNLTPGPRRITLANILTPFQVREMAGLARFNAKIKTMRLAKVKIHGAEDEPDYSKCPTLEDIDRHCRENLGKSLGEIEEAAV